MPTPAFSRLHARLADGTRLVEIHEECTGAAAGRRRGYDALNRSAIILAVAAWEGYTEDLLEAAVGRVVRYMKAPSQLPQSVREAMIAHLHEAEGWTKLTSSSKASIWGLTGDGWRTAYISYARAKIAALHTPDHKNLRKLYASVIGLPDISALWGARRWTAADYVTRLDALLLLRHRIAHGAIGAETVGKTKAANAVALIERLAGWTDKAVVSHLLDLDVRPTKRKSPGRARRG